MHLLQRDHCISQTIGKVLGIGDAILVLVLTMFAMVGTAMVSIDMHCIAHLRVARRINSLGGLVTKITVAKMGFPPSHDILSPLCDCCVSKELFSCR